MTDFWGWVIPAMSWTALVLWLAAFRSAIPSLRGERIWPLDARLAIWTAVLGSTAALALSSLTYAGVLPTDASRIVLVAGRVLLLVTGFIAWYETRR